MKKVYVKKGENGGGGAFSDQGVGRGFVNQVINWPIITPPLLIIFVAVINSFTKCTKLIFNIQLYN